MRSINPSLVLAAAFALLLAGALQAQPGPVIRGLVVDRATGEPIATATVRVTAFSGAVQTAQSNPAGGFSIRLPAEGTYTITAERLGYRGFTSAPVAVAPGEALDVQVRMVANALALDSVAVRVRQVPAFRNPVGRAFFDRMERRDGHFFSPEMLAARQPVQVSALLQSLPGIRPVNGGRHLVMRSTAGIWGPRVCTPTVYVDGEPVPLVRQLDEMVDRDRLWGIEVYTNYLDAPPGLAPRPERRDCGVIAIWTVDG